MKLLILFGPPAVGKTTIGKLLEEQTDFRLFHNHMVMDGVMHLFGVGTPAEDRLSRTLRTAIITEAAENGLNLIFTYVWNFAKDKGKTNIDTYKEIYESRGGEIQFIELIAPLETRVQRADQPDRFDHKQHAPNGERVRHLEEVCNFTSPTPFFYPELHKQIDTTNKSPDVIAREITQSLQTIQLPVSIDQDPHQVLTVA